MQELALSNDWGLRTWCADEGGRLGLAYWERRRLAGIAAEGGGHDLYVP